MRTAMLEGSTDGTMLELAMPTTAETIIAAERALLDPGVRRDRAALDRLLAPEFREIGQSGRLWNRDEILDALTAEDRAEFDAVELADQHLVWLAEGLALLTYRLRVGERSSRRSSIWRVTPDGVVLVFHQGTAVVGRVSGTADVLSDFSEPTSNCHLLIPKSGEFSVLNWEETQD